MKVLVAMSGGVDSSVTAYLLKQQGYEVTGATIRTWASEECPNLNTRACCGVSGVTDARSVARAIDIPYYVFNFEREFKAAVVDYFTREYLRGRTPNPCIVCNQKIKFRLFLKRARTMGIEAIATGHYASVHYREASGRYLVREGLDKKKDQSYVLFALSQEELSHLLLPLGSYRKEQIRGIARELGLCVFNKPDSQEICFIPSNDHGEFIGRQLAARSINPSGASTLSPQPSPPSGGEGSLPAACLPDRQGQAGVRGKEGLIRDERGRILGTHPGHYHFTIGQRRGLGVAAGEKLYVTQIVPERNELILGPKESVRKREFWVSELNWLAEMNGTETFRCEVKIRSNFKKAPATVTLNPPCIPPFANGGEGGFNDDAKSPLIPVFQRGIQGDLANGGIEGGLPARGASPGKIVPPLPTGGERMEGEGRLSHSNPPSPYPSPSLGGRGEVAEGVPQERVEKVKVTFDEPQEAITPGQAAVFYDDDLVIGGGWIESVA